MSNQSIQALVAEIKESSSFSPATPMIEKMFLDPYVFFCGGEWYAFVDEACTTEDNLENANIHYVVMIMMLALSHLFEQVLEEKKNQPRAKPPLLTSMKEIEAMLKNTTIATNPRIDPRTLPSVEKMRQFLPYTSKYTIFDDVLTNIIAIATELR